MTTTLGKRIREAREALKLSQQAVAVRMEVDRAAVSNWERDVNIPRYRRIPRLALFLRVAPEWLERGSGDPNAIVPIIGQIMRDLTVDFSQIDDEAAPPLGFAGRPDNRGPDDFTLVVATDQLRPRFRNGDVLHCVPYAGDPDQLTDVECVIALVDGPVVVRDLHEGGAPGTYTLTAFGAAPILNARIRWIARIASIVPGERA